MGDIWGELSASMRALRRGAGVSLRQTEQESEWGRGFLSQIENEKSHPNRAIVDFYDSRFGGDGMLLAMFVEARTAHEPAATGSASEAFVQDGDAFEIEQNAVAAGQRMAPGEVLNAGWKLHNTGSIDWQGRILRRVGAVAGSRLLRSPVTTPIPDCPAGGMVEVGVPVTAPASPGTVVAYFEVTDAQGRASFRPAALLAVVVVVI